MDFPSNKESVHSHNKDLVYRQSFLDVFVKPYLF